MEEGREGVVEERRVEMEGEKGCVYVCVRDLCAFAFVHFENLV